MIENTAIFLSSDEEKLEEIPTKNIKRMKRGRDREGGSTVTEEASGLGCFASTDKIGGKSVRERPGPLRCSARKARNPRAGNPGKAMIKQTNRGGGQACKH